MTRTKVALTLMLLSCFGLTACAQQGEQQPSSSTEMAPMDMQALGNAMDQVGTAYEQAYNAGDVSALANLYTDDAVRLAPYQDAVRGKAAIEAALTEELGSYSSRALTIERTDFGGAGDLAYSVGTFAVELHVADTPAPVSDHGKFITLAKRGADGSWKIYAQIFNTSLPQADVVKLLSGMSG